MRRRSCKRLCQPKRRSRGRGPAGPTSPTTNASGKPTTASSDRRAPHVPSDGNLRQELLQVPVSRHAARDGECQTLPHGVARERLVPRRPLPEDHRGHGHFDPGDLIAEVPIDAPLSRSDPTRSTSEAADRLSRSHRGWHRARAGGRRGPCRSRGAIAGRARCGRSSRRPSPFRPVQPDHRGPGPYGVPATACSRAASHLRHQAPNSSASLATTAASSS